MFTQVLVKVYGENFKFCCFPCHAFKTTQKTVLAQLQGQSGFYNTHKRLFYKIQRACQKPLLSSNISEKFYISDDFPVLLRRR